MDVTEFDVLIVGGGAAGLQAALELALTGRRVAIVEAKDRVGGRILTHSGGIVPFELGAEFVHGNLKLTKYYLEKAGAEMYTVKGDIWQYKDGLLQEQEDFITDFTTLKKKFSQLQGDKPVARFLEEDLTGEEFEELRFTVQNYVEGYYAADINKASTMALYSELTKGEGEQYRIKGGYGTLVRYLERACQEKGVVFFLSQPVLQVQWKSGEAVAITEKQTLRAKKMLLTVPIGVLQKGTITFFPALPGLQKAAQKLGFGHVVKIVFLFDDAFWKEKLLTGGKDLTSLSFLFSKENIPTWWTAHPRDVPVLTGWLGGPRAKAAQFSNKEEVLEKSLISLSRIFGIDIFRLRQKVEEVHYQNWSADPFTCGAYSYEVVGGNEAIRAVQGPVEETLFFAGEGLHPGLEIGTVEGALSSGRETAQRLVASFS